MSALRNKGLKVEDPTTVSQPVAQSVAAPVPHESATPPEPVWRDWSLATGATSFRLPPELLDELDNRSYQLNVPQGRIVLAALTAGLDLDDQQLTALLDRADQALKVGRIKHTTRKPPRQRASKRAGTPEHPQRQENP